MTPTVSITRTRRDAIPVPRFDAASMEVIGRSAVQTELNRLSTGTNASDQPATPLSEKYARWKARNGGQPVRDLKLTGAMLNSRQVVSVEDNNVTIGFDDPLQELKAGQNELHEQMLGLSYNDKINVGHQIARVLAAKICQELKK